MGYLQNLQFIYRAWRYRLKLEPEEISFMIKSLTAGDTAVDIGAHKGAYTYWMQRAVGRKGRVFSFEPQPKLAAYLEAMRASLGLDHVRVEEMGISSKFGSEELFVPGSGPSPSATLVFPQESISGSTYDVRIESLDNYFKEKEGGPIRLIKVDVEGHELSVFRGAERILSEDRPTLIFECENRHHAHESICTVFDFLEGLGFKGGYYFRGNFQPLSQFNESEHQVSGKSPYINNFIFEHGSPP
jgi:FkbM family methyltransferase